MTTIIASWNNCGVYLILFCCCNYDDIHNGYYMYLGTQRVFKFIEHEDEEEIRANEYVRLCVSMSSIVDWFCCCCCCFTRCCRCIWPLWMMFFLFWATSIFVWNARNHQWCTWNVFNIVASFPFNCLILYIQSHLFSLPHSSSLFYVPFFSIPMHTVKCPKSTVYVFFYIFCVWCVCVVHTVY